MKIKKPEFIISILLIAGIAFMLYQTSLMPASVIPNELGAKFFPYVCLISMAIFSVMLLFSSLNIGRKGEKQAVQSVGEAENTEAESDAGPEDSIKEALLFFALIFVTVIVIYFLGLSIGMAIGVAVMLYMIGWKWPKAIIFSVVSVAVTAVFFQTLIGIPFYKGILLRAFF